MEKEEVVGANFIPLKKVKNREGYSSFIGLIWSIFKINKQCKRSNFTMNLEFKVPIKWI